MKLLKKPVSILLSLIMIFSIFTVIPFTAVAADTSQIEETLSGDTLNGYTLRIRPAGTSYSFSILLKQHFRF